MTTSAWALLAWFAFMASDGRKAVGPAWPVRGVISSPFGRRKHPVTGESQFHHGVDVACPVGTPVCAPVAGVCTIGRSDTGGNMLTLDGDHVRIRFMHLDRIVLPASPKVSVGHVVAYTGTTGRVTGPHCHIEVFVGPPGSMERVDPCAFFNTPKPERLV